MCLTHGKFDDKALWTFRALIERLGNSNITSNEWDEKNYDVFDAMVIGTRLKMHFFFATKVWINPKNSSEHVFSVSYVLAPGNLAKKTLQEIIFFD